MVPAAPALNIALPEISILTQPNCQFPTAPMNKEKNVEPIVVENPPDKGPDVQALLAPSKGGGDQTTAPGQPRLSPPMPRQGKVLWDSDSSFPTSTGHLDAILGEDPIPPQPVYLYPLVPVMEWETIGPSKKRVVEKPPNTQTPPILGRLSKLEGLLPTT